MERSRRKEVKHHLTEDEIDELLREEVVSAVP